MSKKVPPKKTLARIEKKFLRTIVNILTTTDLVLNENTKGRGDVTKFQTFVKKQLVKNQRANKGYFIPINLVSQFKYLEKKATTHIDRYEIIPASLFIYLVAQYDALVQKLFKIILHEKPEILNNSERNISATELLGLNSKTDFITYLVNREVETVLGVNAGKKTFIDWLERKLHLQVSIEEKILNNFAEIVARRNLFVHAGGIIDKKYLSICVESKIKVPSKFTPGKSIQLSGQYLSYSAQNITILGTILIQSIWRKLYPKDIENADTALINDGVEQLIDEQRYRTAEYLYNYVLKKLPPHSNELKSFCVINKALCQKLSGRNKEAISTLNETDWSGCDIKFKLAIAVIKDKYKDVFNLMEKIGKSPEMKLGYCTWPLFYKIKKRANFLKTYKKIYKETYKIFAPTK